MTRWITSDWHFNDKTIIDFANRPFVSLCKMNLHIIDNFHTLKYEQGDDLFVLGDVGEISYLQAINKNLKLTTHLILGNHDNIDLIKNKYRGYFDYIYPYPICLDNFYWLSHEPMYLNSSMPYVNIHGHTHETDMVLMVNGKNMYYNACVDKTNYLPVNFEKIKESYRK